MRNFASLKVVRGFQTFGKKQQMEQLKDHSKAVCVKFLVRYTFPLEIGAFKISICPKKCITQLLVTP